MHYNVFIHAKKEVKKLMHLFLNMQGTYFWIYREWNSLNLAIRKECKPINYFSSNNIYCVKYQTSTQMCRVRLFQRI